MLSLVASGLVSSSKFLIDEDGFITASGGKLGAWTIDDSGIENPEKFEINQMQHIRYQVRHLK